MKTTMRLAIFLLILSAGLSGCRSVAFRSGPVEGFTFTASANPALGSDVVGTLNRFGNPKSVELVVPPKVDLSRLVATVTLNTEGVVTVISSGSRVVQTNGVTPNDFSVPVTYAIEVPGDKEPWTYRISVRHADTNARLADLSVAEGSSVSPVFAPNTDRYSVHVPFATETVTIRARAESRLLSGVSIGGSFVSGSSVARTIAFTGPRRDVVVEATAEDRASTRRYVVTILRDPPDSNALLAALEVSGSELAPKFVASRFTYRATVPFGTTSVEVSALPQSPFAEVALSASTSGSVSVDPRGWTAIQSDFHRGDRTTVGIDVTAQDGSTRRYVVEVSRSRPDSNADLAGLTASAGTMIPKFSPQTRLYSLSLPPVAEGVIIEAEAASPSATVTSPDAPKSGRSSRLRLEIGLNPGETRAVVIDVTAQSGSGQTYRLTVSRPGTDKTPGKPSLDRPPGGTTAQPRPPAGSGTASRGSEPTGTAARPPVSSEPTGSPRPPSTTGRISMSARNLRLEDREAGAVDAGGGVVDASATVTVRLYRTETVLDRQTIPVTVRKQGRTWAVTFDYASPSLSLPSDRLIEAEISISANTDHFLHYTEARRAASQIEVEVPFLLYDSSPRIVWPAVGTLRQVSGYLSLLPPGHDRGIEESDVGSFDRNSRNELGVGISLADASTGSRFGDETVWTRPGLPRNHLFAFESGIRVPEGATLSYAMTARARNGRVWRNEGTGEAWTTKPAYPDGFEPIVLFLEDTLSPEE